jgi:DNA-binding MarR family transcriptional regulator
MQKPSDHPELFRLRPNGKPKFHRELAYWNLPTNPIVEFSDGELVCITREGPGLKGNPRLYANVPGYGKRQGRNLKALLAQLALIDEIRELKRSVERSVQIKLKQLDDAARMLSDVTKDDAATTEEEKARLLAELEAEKEKNARLGDELEALRRRRPELPPSERAQPDKAENFQAAVLILRPALERIVGLKGAIVLQQLDWLLKQEGNGVVLGDGREYIYNTYAQWKSAYFPNWSIPTIKRLFTSLEKAGFVDSKQPEGRRSRRKYYTLSTEGIKLISSAQIEHPKRSLPRDQNDPGNGSKRALPITQNKNTPKHEHDHVHGPCGYSVEELKPPEQDLLDQIEELIANENRTQHFRTTWILRIRDFPTQVFSAIGETRSAKREGKVRKSVGGLLNWHFEQFRKASAKAARK